MDLYEAIRREDGRGKSNFLRGFQIFLFKFIFSLQLGFIFENHSYESDLFENHPYDLKFLKTTYKIITVSESHPIQYSGTQVAISA